MTALALLAAATLALAIAVARIIRALRRADDPAADSELSLWADREGEP